ncbi:MAG: thioredoxin-disulfide reductase [Candidatus Ornithospirochaeta sp.]|nr:thioredoxin-disulfide reductase [Candidatus Ornithospirochaeta sp.]
MECDVLVIGGGPAGLSAAGYAARAGYDTVCIDALAPGGQLLFIDEIENYPGTGMTSGYQLAESFESQAVSFGVRIEFLEARSIRKKDGLFIVETTEDEIRAKAVIAATGARHRHLGAEGEEEYQAKGVSYCATCDGPFFKDKKVIVVGGGDTALTDALYLAKMCKEVVLVHRRNEFRAQKVLQDRVRANDRITLELGKNVVRINGDGKKVVSADLSDGSTIEADGVFVFVGMLPNTALFEGFAELENGFIATDSMMRTSVPGLFAAGDVRTTGFRQVVTAAGDGAMAAHSADEYIQSIAR